MLCYAHKTKGGKKMGTTKKIKRTALILFVAVSLILLWFIAITVWGGFRYAVPVDEAVPIEGVVPIGDIVPIGGAASVGEPLHPVRILIDAVRVILLFSILICALLVLLAIKKDETPFNVKNVKLLRVIAILLAIVEPYGMFADWISSLLSSFGPVVLFLPAGCTLAAGLVVYCISLVFEHGVSLQKQTDETL